MMGMLALMLTFGMLVIGCETDPDTEEPSHNKFYGTWVQAIAVSDVSFLDDAEQAAGMGNATGYEAGKATETSSPLYYRSFFYIKDGNQWYEQDYDLLWYYFENTTYTYSTGSSGEKSASISYTFTESEITTESGVKSYTLTSKTTESGYINIFKWGSTVLLRTTIVV
jgi:hypothetical protein